MIESYPQHAGCSQAATVSGISCHAFTSSDGPNSYCTYKLVLWQEVKEAGRQAAAIKTPWFTAAVKEGTWDLAYQCIFSTLEACYALLLILGLSTTSISSNMRICCINHWCCPHHGLSYVLLWTTQTLLGCGIDCCTYKHVCDCMCCFCW